MSERSIESPAPVVAAQVEQAKAPVITAKISIYTKRTQTKKDSAGIKQSSIAEVLHETHTIVLRSNDRAKQLAQASYIAPRLIGSRCAAFVETGKKMPSLVFFRTVIEGTTYDSQTLLAKANLVQVARISFSKVAELEDAKAIVESVANTQGRALTASVNHLNRTRAIMADADAIEVSDIAPESYAVAVDGELVAN